SPAPPRKQSGKDSAESIIAAVRIGPGELLFRFHAYLGRDCLGSHVSVPHGRRQFFGRAGRSSPTQGLEALHRGWLLQEFAQIIVDLADDGHGKSRWPVKAQEVG